MVTFDIRDDIISSRYGDREINIAKVSLQEICSHDNSEEAGVIYLFRGLQSQPSEKQAEHTWTGHTPIWGRDAL